MRILLVCSGQINQASGHAARCLALSTDSQLNAHAAAVALAALAAAVAAVATGALLGADSAVPAFPAAVSALSAAALVLPEAPWVQPWSAAFALAAVAHGVAAILAHERWASCWARGCLLKRK
jgi:hypothetical protein